MEGNKRTLRARRARARDERQASNALGRARVRALTVNVKVTLGLEPGVRGRAYAQQKRGGNDGHAKRRRAGAHAEAEPTVRREHRLELREGGREDRRHSVEQNDPRIMTKPR